MTTVTMPAGSLFGPANLPYGVFSVGGSEPRVGTRLSDTVIDLAVLLGDEVFARRSLNAFMAQGYDRWVEVRRQIGERVAGEVPDEAVHAVLVAGADAGAPDRQRGSVAHRGPVRLRHGLGAGEGDPRGFHRAYLGRRGTGHRGRRAAHLPRGRRRGRPHRDRPGPERHPARLR